MAEECQFRVVHPLFTIDFECIYDILHPVYSILEILSALASPERGRNRSLPVGGFPLSSQRVADRLAWSPSVKRSPGFAARHGTLGDSREVTE